MNGSTLTPTQSYSWGLDLAGSRTQTGGVGALIQIADHATGVTYFPTYDGNGNIVALLNAGNGAVVARYEYSPFGELLRMDGDYAARNPFRFSTKFMDDETGLIYYGHRYYSPSLGRFINQDPIEEAGGINLYGFCGNNPVNGFDVLGMDGIIDATLDAGITVFDNGQEVGTLPSQLYSSIAQWAYDNFSPAAAAQKQSVTIGPMIDPKTGKVLVPGTGQIATTVGYEFASNRVVTEADAPAQQEARHAIGRTKAELPQITPATRAVILVRGDIAAGNSIQYRDKSMSVLKALRHNAATLNQKLGSAVVVVSTWNTKADLDASFQVLAGSGVNYAQVSSHGGGKDARGMYLLQVPDGSHSVTIAVEGGFNTMRTGEVMSYGDITRAAAEQGFTGSMNFVHCSDRGNQSWVTSITNLQEQYNVKFPVVSW